jgi:hypothetical protein
MDQTRKDMILGAGLKYFVSSSNKIITCSMNATLINIRVKLFKIKILFDTISKFSL